jgi:beta-N-acetylhexosaminidase
MEALPKTKSNTIGQLLVIGFEGTEMSPRLASLLDDLQPAGVILFGRNIVSAEQTHALLKACQQHVRTPLFTAVDLEGGRVDRFREIFGHALSAANVFATGDRKLFHHHGRLIGLCCRALGFNTDFAPVVDLALPASEKVMSSRAVSADPKKVVVYAREFLAGLASAGVIGCTKHFPGLGEADLDTHSDLPSVHKSWKNLWADDIYPYRALRRVAPLVLVGHANYPTVTKDALPASLSHHWITKILRKKIGYRGLIVSDDLEMGGVVKAAPPGEAAVEFIRAGGDLALVCHLEENVRAAHEGLAHEAEKDRRFARRAAESLSRVAAFKKKSSDLKRKSPTLKPEKVSQLSRTLWEFSEQVRLSDQRRTDFGVKR